MIRATQRWLVSWIRLPDDENVEVGVGPVGFSIVICEELATSAMTRVQTRGPVLHYMAREARASRTPVNEPAKPRWARYCVMTVL
ncbi:hypothetical protein ASD02_34590 [Ensifer sp. Root1252]|jgi:hypothetical protein|nr:hypothetical protein ASD00_29635 [Ensifer sp. Root31]KQW46802.1 hypothetical protein ASD02_34590 [Ensifer sp. Root1252]KQW60320.1 hypothetical protein ASD03_36915 [Ensifer sp. Root127]KQY69465.1 hypothetical protein ASD52_32005 [Ensifer sp. Root142]KRC69356.1 hypothetical protein ASE32_34410 [Ensifer sp. Root231]KRC96632.1 hypothetical protein ASE47_30675 [Ensifer sp. Root258]